MTAPSRGRALRLEKLLLVTAAAALVCGCGAFSQRPEDAIRVRGTGTGHDETSSTAAARRAAITAVLDLYLSPEAAAEGSAALDAKIYPRAKEFLSREREVSRARGPGSVTKTIEAWVNASMLGRALDAEGLSRPDGVRGRPRVLVALRDQTAARGLIRELSARGYRAQAGEPEKDAVSIAGAVSVRPVDDPRLAGLFGASAKVEGALRGVGEPAPVVVEAQAFDVTREGASERALENAGLLAAQQARRRLAQHYVERSELSLIVENLGGAAQIRKLVGALRGEPGVSAASLEAVSGRDVKLRLFGERLTADELAARLTRLPGYSIQVRAVDVDLGAVEVLQSGEAPGA